MKYHAASGNLPGDLLWSIVRNHHSFLVKRDGGRNVFSAEQNNLRNEHSFTQNGLVNEHSIGITGTKRKDHRSAFSISIKSKNGLHRPSKQFKSVIAGRDIKRDFRRLARGVRRTAKTTRPDLTHDALARLSAVHRVLLRARKSRAARKARKESKKSAVVAAK